MNLAWLAAILSPRDVAIHPDFEERSRDLAPAFLAAVVLGDGWRLRRPATASEPWQQVSYPDPAIRYVQDTFRSETLEQGLAELSGILLDQEPDDIARNGALTLLACCAAAELDDYDTCEKLIKDQLRWTANIEHPDNRLVRAALLQQRSLRFRDSGRPYEECSIEALRLLAGTDPTTYSEFELSQSVSWTSAETTAQIVSTIRDAAYSLLSGHNWESHDAFDLVLTPRQRIQAPDVQYLLLAD